MHVYLKLLSFSITPFCPIFSVALNLEQQLNFCTNCLHNKDKETNEEKN